MKSSIVPGSDASCSDKRCSALVQVAVLTQNVCFELKNTGGSKESGDYLLNSFVATEAQVEALQYPEAALDVGGACRATAPPSGHSGHSLQPQDASHQTNATIHGAFGCLLLPNHSFLCCNEGKMSRIVYLFYYHRSKWYKSQLFRISNITCPD